MLYPRGGMMLWLQGKLSLVPANHHVHNLAIPTLTRSLHERCQKWAIFYPGLSIFVHHRSKTLLEPEVRLSTRHDEYLRQVSKLTVLEPLDHHLTKFKGVASLLSTPIAK